MHEADPAALTLARHRRKQLLCFTNPTSRCATHSIITPTAGLTNCEIGPLGQGTRAQLWSRGELETSSCLPPKTYSKRPQSIYPGIERKTKQLDGFSYRTIGVHKARKLA